MIRIEKIEFCNFRQYKDYTVSFDNNEYNLHILRAKNGTGKTTFLNGISWCLYAKEYFISDSSKALKVINEGIVQDSSKDDVLEVSVRLTVADEDKIVIFHRTQKFVVSIDPLSENKNCIPTSDSILKVLENPENSSNAKVYESEDDVLRIVKQYFDEDIYTYYFFDGENLKHYFDKDNSDRVKKSIFSLSQVNVLKSASERTRLLGNDKSKEKLKKGGIDNGIYDDIDKLQDEIERLEQDNHNLDREIPVLEKRIKDLSDELAGFKPVRDRQLKRKDLEKKLKQLYNEQDEIIAQKKEFIRVYYTLFNLFPRIKSTLDMISYKEAHGELPPRIDKKQLEELIANHEANCPMCDGEINDHAIIHMKQLIEDLDVSSQTSNYLSSIKGGLENAIDKCKKYVKERDHLIEKEKYYNLEINEVNNELNEISKYLATYSDSSSDVIDVSKLEKERNEAQNEIYSKQQRKGANDLSLKNDLERLENLNKKANEMKKLDGEKNQLSKEINVLENLTLAFDRVKRNLMDEIKIEIENRTWELFNNMIWKKQTFARLDINDDYQMSIYNYNYNDMTGSLSATESMALAYSFTLAIHETSGRNCPLVVDSPLGRVSDDNRVNMAKELLKISKNKQIIMLFTPDEYSSEVADVYDNIIATIKDISLTEDEKEVRKED